MYSQQELDDAVAAGVITVEAANALRAHVESQRSIAIPDEEQFRLMTGFNDIFVSIAAAILLFAVGWIGQSIGQATGLLITDHGDPGRVSLLRSRPRRRHGAGALLYRPPAHGASLDPAVARLCRRRARDRAFLLVQIIGPERFNEHQVTCSAPSLRRRERRDRRRRRLDSLAQASTCRSPSPRALPPSRAVPRGRRRASFSRATEAARNLILGFVLLLGIGMFLFAMWWDSSDRARLTRRSDVAFWLHLLAAPMIAHPVFTLIGLTTGAVGVGEGLAVVGLYVLFGLTALAVDRRALLVSALAYVLYALTELFKRFGAVELNVALTALVIGSALLMLSAYWHQARRLIVTRLPSDLQARFRRSIARRSRTQPAA